MPTAKIVFCLDLFAGPRAFQPLLLLSTGCTSRERGTQARSLLDLQHCPERQQERLLHQPGTLLNREPQRLREVVDGEPALLNAFHYSIGWNRSCLWQCICATLQREDVWANHQGQHILHKQNSLLIKQVLGPACLQHVVQCIIREVVAMHVRGHRRNWHQHVFALLH